MLGKKFYNPPTPPLPILFPPPQPGLPLLISSLVLPIRPIKLIQVAIQGTMYYEKLRKVKS